MIRKNLLALATLAVLLYGCNGIGSDKKTVTINIDDTEGSTVTFAKRVQSGVQVLDSATVSGGKAVLEIPNLPLDFYQVVLDGNAQLTVVVDSTESLSITTTKESFDSPTGINGSTHTSKFHEWMNAKKANEKEISELRDAINKNPEDRTLVTRYNELSTKYLETNKAFIQENPGTPTLIFALGSINFQQEPDLFSSAVSSLRGKMDHSMFFKQLNSQAQRYEQMLAQQEQQRKMQEAADKMTPIGGVAPDFTQKTPAGKDLSLSDLRGKIVLLDFWASWCKPCRLENPNVVRMYNKYKNKGFDILSVSLDKNQPAWERAIEQDGMTWHHCSDLAAWSNAAARQYGVSSIPKTFLLDREGKILAKNLRGAALEQKLEEIFGS